VANDQERQEQRQTLQKRVALKEDGYYANCSMVEMTPFDLSILHVFQHTSSSLLRRSA